MRECDLGIIYNKAQLYNILTLPVAAGQWLEDGMPVTCNGPVSAVGRRAKRHTVRVIVQRNVCQKPAHPGGTRLFGRFRTCLMM